MFKSPMPDIQRIERNKGIAAAILGGGQILNALYRLRREIEGTEGHPQREYMPRISKYIGQVEKYLEVEREEVRLADVLKELGLTEQQFLSMGL